MAPHGNNNSIMNAFAAMEEEERQQQQRERQQQQHEARSMFTGNNSSIHSNDANGNANANHASVLKSDVSPLQTFLRHQGGQLQGQQQVQQMQQQQQVLVGGTLEDENDVTSRVWNPLHHDDEDNDDDDEEDCPLPIDSDHTDVNDIRDAVDIALAQIGGDCDDSLIDLDDVEEFFADIEEDENNANGKVTINHGHGHGHGRDDDNFGIGNNQEEDRQGFNDYYSSAEANHDSMTSIEFAPLAGPNAVVGRHHQQQQQFRQVSIIEGMEVLTDGSSSVPPPNNNNNNLMDYSSRNMGDSGRGSLASLGSLTGAFSKLNQCMQHTAQTREMIQQLSSPNLQNDDVFDGSIINNNNSCSSLPMPNLSFHSLPSAGRSNRGRPTKSLTRLTKTDLLGRSSSLRSLGSVNGGGVRKASTKATLKSSSTTSLRSMGSSSSNSSKRRSSSHLRGQRYTKKRSSCSSLSTMKSDENPLVTGIAPINWDGI